MKKFFRPSKPKGNELSPTPLALPPETPIHAAHAQQANGNAAYSQRPSELTNAPNGGQDRSGWVVVDPSSDGSSAGERTWSSTDAPPPMAPPPNPGRTRVDSKPSSISSLSLQAQAVLHATTNATAGIAAAVAAPVTAGAPPPQALQSQTNPSLMSSAPPTPASSAPASAIRTSPKSPPPLSAVNTSRQPSSQPQRSPSTKQSTKDSSTGKRRSGQIFPWADQRIPQHTNSTNTTSPSVSRSGTLSEQHQQSHHRPSPLHSQPNPNSIIAPLVSSPDPRPTSTYSTDTTATRDMLDSAHVMTPQHYHHPPPPMQLQQQQPPTIAKKEEKEQGTRRHLADLFFASSHKDAASNKSKHPSFDVEVTVRNLVQSASEDWSIVFDLCDYVARSESAAKDAARGIRRALKYGQATQQLMAARLWAVMLRNMTVSASPQSSSDPGRDVKEKEREPLFMRETSSKKFMETVEEVATTTKVEPVVRERLREILGGAVFEYTRTPQGGVDRKHPYVILWRKIKARSAPDEGVPLNPNDPMWNLPLPVPAPGSEPNAIPPHVRNRAEWSSSPTPSMLTTTTDRGQGGVPYSQHGRDPSLSSLPPPSQSQSSLLDSPAEQQQQQQQREQRRLQKRNPKQPSQPQPQPQSQIQPIPQFPTDQRGSEYEFIDEREVRMARADAPAVPSKPPRDRERHRDRERDQKQERPVRSERERPPSSPNLPLSVPSIDVQIRQIYAECEAAQAKAQLLSDNVAQANVDEVEGGGSPTGPKGRNGGQSIIDEFYADCVRAQERVMNQIAWATAEAEKSRERLSTATPNANGKEQQPNGNRERGTVVTKEEEMLGALLGANQALTDAIQMRDDWQRAAIAAREERWVEERSRVETRIDRSQMFMAPDGTLYAPEQDPRNIAGSSRSPSPSPRALPRPMPPASDTGTLSSSYDSDSYHPQSNGHANPYTQPQSAAQQPAHRAPNRAQPYQQVESFYSGSIQPTGGMYYTNPQGNASQSLLTPQTPSNGASVTPTPSTPSQLAAPIPRINELPPTPQGHAQAQGATRAPGGGSGGGTTAQLSLAAPPSAPNSNLPTPTARTAPHGPRALGAGMHQHMYSRSRTPSPDLIAQQVRHQRSAESEDLTQSQLRDMRAPAVLAAGAVGMGLAAVGLASAMGAAPGSINHTTPLPPTPGEETVRLVSSRTRNPDSRGASGAVSPPPPGFPLNQAPQQTPALTQAQAYAYQQQQRQQAQAQTPPPNQQQFHHHQLPTPPQLAPGQVQPQSAHAAYIAGGVYGYQQQPQYQQPQQQYQPPSQQYQPTQWGEDDDLSHIPSEPLVPSAKALGKRRAKEKVYDPDAFDPDDIYKDPRQRAMYGLAPNDKPDSDSDDAADDEPYDEPGHAGHHHNIPKKPIVYAYDAAAEREKEWQRMEKERERAAAREREGRRASKGAPAVPAR